MPYDAETPDTTTPAGEQRQPIAPQPESITMLPSEIEALTGYRQAGKQLEELLRQGFWRARIRPVTGGVLLEREHYRAVCAGVDGSRPQPKLKAPQLCPVQPPKGRR